MENQNQQSSVPPSNLPSIPTSPPQIDKHTAVWLVILLFLVFPPAALFIIFKEKYYHGWLAILLWLYAIPLFLTYLVMRISVIPQLENLYKSLNVPNSIPVINSIIILFMVFLLAQIIFGIILFKKNRLIGYLSKNLLIIALLFFIMDLFVSPGFIIVGIVKPIYNLTSSIGEPTTPKTTQFSPTLIIDETANWKTYTDIKNEFSIQYPNNWYISAWPDTRAPHPEFDTVNFGRYKLPSTFQGNEELKKLGYIIEILIKKEDKTLEEIAKSNDETLKNRKGYKRENIIFQGLPALKIYNTGFDFPADTVILIKDKKLYSIGVKYLSDDKEAKEMYRKILSTFKFTDQNQTINTSWQLYPQAKIIENTELAINYPEGWIVQFKKENISSPDYLANFRIDFDFLPSGQQANPESVDWMGWGSMHIDVYNAKTDINQWIGSYYAKDKDNLIAIKDVNIGGKNTFLISAKPSAPFYGGWISRYVILGSKYSYELGFSQNGKGDFGKIIEEQIFPNMKIN